MAVRSERNRKKSLLQSDRNETCKSRDRQNWLLFGKCWVRVSVRAPCIITPGTVPQKGRLPFISRPLTIHWPSYHLTLSSWDTSSVSKQSTEAETGGWRAMRWWYWLPIAVPLRNGCSVAGFAERSCCREKQCCFTVSQFSALYAAEN
jgi:hypothetical protein